MNVSRRDSLRRAFVLTEEDVRALSERLGVLGVLSYTLECSDGLSREFDAVEEVLKFDNSPQRSIERLTVNARSTDFLSRASLWFAANEEFNNLTLSLEGPDEVVVRLNQEIEARLSAIRPWYDVLTRGHSLLLAFGSLYTGLIGLMLWAAGSVAFGPASAGPSDKKTEALVLFVFITGVIVYSLLAWLLHRIRQFIFPIGTFTLGAGKRRYDVRERVRWIAVSFFITSAGVILAGAYRWIAR